MRAEIATALGMAFALAACSRASLAATAKWECVAPPDFYRHISDETQRGPDYFVSGKLTGQHADDSSEEWSSSASAVIFRADRKRMVALRIAHSADEQRSD